MQQELMGWMRLFRSVVIWVVGWLVMAIGLDQFATWAALPKGGVLDILLFVVTYLLTSATASYIHNTYFGGEPGETKTKKEPFVHTRVYHTDTGQRTTLYDSHRVIDADEYDA